MKFYVASAFEERGRARRAIDELTAAGLVCTLDWTRLEGPGYETEKKIAEAEVLAVTEAKVLLVLAPPTKEIGKGVWTELGVALSVGTYVVMVDRDRQAPIFGWLAGTRVVSDADGLLAVRRLAAGVTG